MMEFLREQSGVILEYDDRLVRRLVEKVTVNQDGMIVEFKPGVEVGAVKFIIEKLFLWFASSNQILIFMFCLSNLKV